MFILLGLFISEFCCCFVLYLRFRRYSQFSDAQNNRIQWKFNTIIDYLKINISEFRLILLNHITYYECDSMLKKIKLNQIIYFCCLFPSGLVPIMIGRSAVDPVSGELSPVTGVRVNQDTGITVPVTMASSAMKKRKPPLGAVSCGGTPILKKIQWLINRAVYLTERCNRRHNFVKCFTCFVPWLWVSVNVKYIFWERKFYWISFLRKLYKTVSHQNWIYFDIYAET